MYEQERRKLILGLKQKGIRDERLLSVLSALPREFFISANLRKNAYTDNALPIDCGQTISQPYTIAYMTELLKVEPGSKVLEIGTGSGYQAAILHRLGARVYSVERIPHLFNRAVKLFRTLDMDISCYLGDGTEGLSEFSPYDRIIVTAAAPDIPAPLISQLGINGRMVIPVGGKAWQSMVLIIKTDKNSYKRIDYESFRFVPLIGSEGWEE